jgi:hypothetical protein
LVYVGCSWRFKIITILRPVRQTGEAKATIFGVINTVALKKRLLSCR